MKIFKKDFLKFLVLVACVVALLLGLGWFFVEKKELLSRRFEKETSNSWPSQRYQSPCREISFDSLGRVETKSRIEKINKKNFKGLSINSQAERNSRTNKLKESQNNSFIPRVLKPKSRIEKLNDLMQKPLDWLIKNIDGEVIDFYCFREQKILILNFWATWCPPCVQELASLSQLAHRYKKDIFVVAISSEEIPTIKKFLTRSFGELSQEIKFASVKETEQLKYFPKDKLPVTYIFDTKGHLKIKELGYRDWSNPNIIKTILNLKAIADQKQFPNPKDSSSL